MDSHKAQNVNFGTVVQEDGKIAVGAIEDGKVIAQHVFDQNGAVAFGAHLLNNATSAQKRPLTPELQENGIVYGVGPGAISLADGDNGQQLRIILWFGEAGISFPIERAMAQQLFGAVIAASASGAKH